MTTDRFREIKRILLQILLLNWAVAGAKIGYGLMTNFTSMTADGFHSLSDGGSNILGLIGITIACWPADNDHPYGHRKYETLFSLGIAAVLFYLCFNLISEGIRHMRSPHHPQIDIVTLLVMVLTTFVNILVMKYEHKEGKRLKSDILISDAMHTKADVFTSFSVIVAMAGVKLGLPIVDPIVTIVI